MSSKMSKICDKSVFVIFRPINTHYCHSRGCTLQHNLHSVFSQRPCSPDTYFAMQCYSRVHYFALYFSCIFNLKRIGSQVNEDDDFHNLRRPALHELRLAISQSANLLVWCNSSAPSQDKGSEKKLFRISELTQLYCY